MAATDKHYRDQNTLDLVFALSSIAMLVGLILMLIQDFNREYKVEQRVFRDVEVAMAQRTALEQLPDHVEFEEARKEVEIIKGRRTAEGVDKEIEQRTKKIAELEEEREQKQAALAKAKGEAVKTLQQEVEGLERRLRNQTDVIAYLQSWKSFIATIPEKRRIVEEKRPDRDRKEQRFQVIKADVDSISSFYDIEVEHHGHSAKAQQYKDQIKALNEKLDEAKAERDTVVAEIKAAEAAVNAYVEPLTKATARLKKLSDQFDIQVKTALSKTWGVGDWFRSWPILDAFASPVKIHEVVIPDVPIDYNFVFVPRFDRCATCHLGITRDDYTKEKLFALHNITDDQDIKFGQARQLLKERRAALAGLPEQSSVPDPSALKLLTLDKNRLTEARVTQFCAHPRMDLYVGPSSKHPVEKFGCTACHAGQGSSTSFVLAAHAPNNAGQEKDWKGKYAWEPSHMWDFPMLPKRFIESSCLKCHHQVTDLIGSDNRSEAPKVVQGFRTIQDVGCFGCHEIAGRKGGRPVGPDLRLESFPPLEDLTPAQRARIESDPDTAPGTYRKVGPSLFRLSEKTYESFVRKWIYSPRSFRPDTKMPHYYNLDTNSQDVLPADQKDFPTTEVYAITRVLFGASKGYLKELSDLKDPKKGGSNQARLADHAYQTFLGDYIESRATMNKARLDTLVGLAKIVPWTNVLEKPFGDRTFADKIREDLSIYGDRLTADQNRDVAKILEDELKEVTRRIKLRDQVPLLVDQAVGLKGDEKRGRVLFAEKGCMACHVHDAMSVPQGAAGDKDYSPAFHNDAEFGPTLSQVKEKLVDKGGDETRPRIWLLQWLLDPTVHSPRTRMPSTHLSRQEAADVAAWILAQPATDMTKKWAEFDEEFKSAPDLAKVTNLAKVYLVRILAKSEWKSLLEEKGSLPEVRIRELPAEEKWLAQEMNKAARAGDVGDQEKDELRKHSLTEYVGKKAIGRLGCYGCHDIPGFESAKPIGVALNDWGKKPAERLAFEDIKSFLEKHYHVVESTVNEQGKPVPPVVIDGHEKRPYEAFFANLLLHHTREGFLNQKLLAPRSYDFNRNRAWDDRYRMPQFQFSKFRLPPQVKVDQAAVAALGEFVGRKGKINVDDTNALVANLPDLPQLAALKKELEEKGPDFLAKVEFDTTKPLPLPLISDIVAKAETQLGIFKARVPSELEVKGLKIHQEDKARETVSTFILGLVAEPVPMQSVNQPKGDRAAEVRGRQILEKYNCNSCHLVRPGYFEFKATPNTKTYLETVHKAYLGDSASSYAHPEHYFWTGDDPKATVKAMVNWPIAADGKPEFGLLEALRFAGSDRTLRDIGTLQKLMIGEDFGVRPKDMISPPPSAFASAEELSQYLRNQGPFGGTFGDSLARYLMEKTKGDASPLTLPNARSSTPPFLIAQGEKTQPDWLYQFLLNPHPVRKMVVLRMPKFNMSQDEARALVDYFSAVERIGNPGIGLTAPFENIKQRDGLDSAFWKAKNDEYVARLKSSYVKGPDGKDTKTTWYQKRIDELTPVWEYIARDHEGRTQTAKGRMESAQVDFDRVNKDYEPLSKELTKVLEELKTKEGELSGAKDKAKLEGEIAALKKSQAELQAKLAKIQPEYDHNSRVLESWKTEHNALAKEAGDYKPKELEGAWSGGQAYLTDSFRLLFNKNLCAQCHQVGERETPASTPGPSLTMSHTRLRPGWIERWVTNPKYFLHYTPMPVNFEKGKLNYQEMFVGSSFEQIQAVRDVLMVYPQVASLPLNRHWVLPPAVGKAEGGKADEKGKDKKTGDMK